MRDDPQAVAQALGTAERKTIKGLMWGMRKNPEGWSINQANECDALATAFGSQECTGMATEDGTA
jgi:hypothetical protein